MTPWRNALAVLMFSIFSLILILAAVRMSARTKVRISVALLIVGSAAIVVSLAFLWMVSR